MLMRATSPPPPSVVSVAASWESRTLHRDGEDDWEEVAAATPGAGDAEVDSDYKIVFWSPPTGDEVRAAFSSIQEVFEGSYYDVDSDETHKQIALLSNSEDSSSSNSSGSDDWVEPAAYVLNSTSLLTREHMNVLDAFHLLQRDPNVQKMVMSLSCDRTVWDAVMNNEAVREFRRSFHDDTVVSYSCNKTFVQKNLATQMMLQKKFLPRDRRRVDVFSLAFHVGQLAQPDLKRCLDYAAACSVEDLQLRL
ncbi:hypothetical protein D1007_58193 [Hordeum vulgare]|nr:hypothetical protein D1007_58193 [Hordeum vulgare]